MKRLFRRLTGVGDFHSHIRWNAIRRYVDFNAARTVELGANTGVMSIEVATRNPGGLVVASEYDADLVALAQRVKDDAGVTNVVFSQADIRDLANAEEPFDQALVIDVLEHIDDHQEAVRQVARLLRQGGRLVVSVPTPRYPIVFGRPYHESIGHVRDGYLFEDLKALLQQGGFEVRDYHLYTGRVASWLCSLYYRRGLPGQLASLLMPVAVPIALVAERFTGQAYAASLAVVAFKR
jgi:ubiquinone/menaquinone biosynthesis C-methylase UbiE